LKYRELDAKASKIKIYGWEFEFFGHFSHIFSRTSNRIIRKIREFILVHLFIKEATSLQIDRPVERGYCRAVEAESQ